MTDDLTPPDQEARCDELLRAFGPVVPGYVKYNEDMACWVATIDAHGGYHEMLCTYGRTEQQALERRDLLLAAMSPRPLPDTGMVERAELCTLLESRMDEEFDGECHLTNEEASLIVAALRASPMREALGRLHIVFDGSPGPTAGRFVEVETPDGRSVKAGEWHKRVDGYWELRIDAALSGQAPEEAK